MVVFVSMMASSDVLAVEIFRDDFDFFDTTKWSCQDRNWPIGQTWFKCYPKVANSIATFEHHTYNQFDKDHKSCLSQEIFTNTEFSRGVGLEIEARVRVRAPIGNGLVASFFLYMDKPNPNPPPPDLVNDEIDFEFLTNQINNPPEPGGHRVILASYNDFDGDWANPDKYWGDNPFVPGLNLTEFNVFKIHWHTDCVEWFWDPDRVYGEDLYPDELVYKTYNALPDDDMRLHFNFWAADKNWPLAWDGNLLPAQYAYDNVISYFDVDYVEVRTIIPEPATIMLLGLGGLALIKIRKL